MSTRGGPLESTPQKGVSRLKQVLEVSPLRNSIPTYTRRPATSPPRSPVSQPIGKPRPNRSPPRPSAVAEKQRQDLELMNQLKPVIDAIGARYIRNNRAPDVSSVDFLLQLHAGLDQARRDVTEYNRICLSYYKSKYMLYEKGMQALHCRVQLPSIETLSASYEHLKVTEILMSPDEKYKLDWVANTQEMRNPVSIVYKNVKYNLQESPSDQNVYTFYTAKLRRGEERIGLDRSHRLHTKLIQQFRPYNLETSGGEWEYDEFDPTRRVKAYDPVIPVKIPTIGTTAESDIFTMDLVRNFQNSKINAIGCGTCGGYGGNTESHPVVGFFSDSENDVVHYEACRKTLQHHLNLYADKFNLETCDSYLVYGGDTPDIENGEGLQEGRSDSVLSRLLRDEETHIALGNRDVNKIRLMPGLETPRTLDAHQSVSKVNEFIYMIGKPTIVNPKIGGWIKYNTECVPMLHKVALGIDLVNKLHVMHAIVYAKLALMANLTYGAGHGEAADECGAMCSGLMEYFNSITIRMMKEKEAVPPTVEMELNQLARLSVSANIEEEVARCSEAACNVAKRVVDAMHAWVMEGDVAILLKEKGLLVSVIDGTSYSIATVHSGLTVADGGTAAYRYPKSLLDPSSDGYEAGIQWTEPEMGIELWHWADKLNHKFHEMVRFVIENEKNPSHTLMVESHPRTREEVARMIAFLSLPTNGPASGEFSAQVSPPKGVLCRSGEIRGDCPEMIWLLGHQPNAVPDIKTTENNTMAIRVDTQYRRPSYGVVMVLPRENGVAYLNSLDHHEIFNHAPLIESNKVLNTKISEFVQMKYTVYVGPRVIFLQNGYKVQARVIIAVGPQFPFPYHVMFVNEYDVIEMTKHSEQINQSPAKYITLAMGALVVPLPKGRNGEPWPPTHVEWKKNQSATEMTEATIDLMKSPLKLADVHILPLTGGGEALYTTYILDNEDTLYGIRLH